MNDINLVSFLSKLHGITVHHSSYDSVKWDLNPKGIFTVKSFYMKLHSLASSHIQLFSVDHLPTRLFQNPWLHLKFPFCLVGKLPIGVL